MIPLVSVQGRAPATILAPILARIRATIGATILACGGCSGVCRGPGCEASWPAARLSVFEQGPQGSSSATPEAWAPKLGVLADALALQEGTAEQGSSWSVAFLAHRIVIGQPDNDRVDQLDLTDDPSEPSATWLDEEGKDRFGASVAVSVRGQAFDLWVGAPERELSRGAVYLFRGVQGGGGRSAAQADLIVEGVTPADRLGQQIVVCDDLTGDGASEILISSPWFGHDPELWPFDSVPPDLAGAVFLLESERVAEATGQVFPWEIGRTWWGGSTGEGAGSALACGREILIGAPWYREPGSSGSDDPRGRIYRLTPLPDSGPLEDVVEPLNGPDGSDWFGSSVALLDQRDTKAFAVGCPGYRRGAGRVLLYALDEEGAPITPVTFVQSTDRSDHFGRTLYAGDLDADGFDDLIVGNPDYTELPNGYDIGRLWIWLGDNRDTWREGLPASTADHEIVGQQPFLRIGRGVHVGDHDGDGYDSLLVPTRAPSPAGG